MEVSANSAKSISFLILPKKIGNVVIKAVAATHLAGDTVEKVLLVEPPGATVRVNRGFLLDLGSKSQLKENITIDIPKNSIHESILIEVSVVGDLIGSIIPNIGRLMQLPIGCGEQTMSNFNTNTFILQYLQVNNDLSCELKI